MDLLNVRSARTPAVVVKVPTVDEFIYSNKIVLTHRGAVMHLVNLWAGLSHTWQWKAGARNKGVHGFPLGLTDGIKFIDKLLCGHMDGYPLYCDHVNTRWNAKQIQYSMEQFNIAASSPMYHPLDPARKLHLQRTSLSQFFWNGRIKGEANAYTHAPFLFFFDKGAQLNADAMTKRMPTNAYLFNAAMKVYVASCENPNAPVRTIDNNRLVRFTDALQEFYKAHEARLHPANRTPAFLVSLLQSYFATWKKPVRMQAFTCTKALDDIKGSLQAKATYVETYVPPVAAIEIEDIYKPTALLGNVAAGDALGAFCTFCARQGVPVDSAKVDSRKLLENSHLALRQLARLWRLGHLLKAETAPTAPVDWKALLLAQKAKLGIV